MNSLNHINHTSLPGGVSARSQVEKQKAVDANDWFSLSGSSSGNTIHATATFSAGAGVKEIASQILSHISEPTS